MHTIAYQHRHEYPPGKEGIFLPVSLKLGRETVTIEAAVDTGASFCLFARSVAESLGIDVESGLSQVFASANGTVEAFGHTVQLTVVGMDFHAMAYLFAIDNIRKNLLGRRGWLDRILFGLDEYRQTVYLSNAG